MSIILNFQATGCTQGKPSSCWKWQGKGDRCAETYLTVCLNLSPVGSYQAPGDRQPQTAAAGICALVEPLEDVRQILGRDARPCIVDRKGQAIVPLDQVTAQRD